MFFIRSSINIDAKAVMALLVTSPANASITDSAATASVTAIDAKANKGAFATNPDGSTALPTLIEAR
jgi:alkaline phosphatase